MMEQRGITNKLVSEIAKKYEIYSRILERVLAPFASLKAEPKEAREALAKVREVVRRLNIEATIWTLKAAEKAYRSKSREVGNAAESVGNLEVGKRIDVESKIRKMAESAASEFIKANSTIETSCSDFLSAYEKAFAAVGSARAKVVIQAISAKMQRELENQVERLMEQGADAGSIARSLKTYLRDAIGGKDFIKIGERFYNIRDFAELTARAEMHKIQVEATIDECEKWENDLVQMSRHDDPCEICGPLEGMVFSISGEDEEYPWLDDPVTVDTMKGPVDVDPKFPHFNCEHNLNPVTRRILEAAGER